MGSHSRRASGHGTEGPSGPTRKGAICLLGVVFVITAGCATSTPGPIASPTAQPTTTIALESPLISNTATLDVGAYTLVVEPTTTPLPSATSSPATLRLRGTVLQRSNCRYGPDWPYLYKYGLSAGTEMDVIGRDADGDWLQVQAVGGHNPCWIKGAQIQAAGDVMDLPDAYTATKLLPLSPLFPYVTITSTTRSGSTVAVDWAEHNIRGRADTGEGIEYIVEVWTCVGGKPNFSAYGFPPGETSFSFQVDDSCGFSSHADLVGEDKEGFSLPAEIPVR